MKRNLFLILLAPILLTWACTPKVAEETPKEEPVVEAPAQPEPDSPCPTFKDAPNEDEVIEAYVLCRDEIRAGRYENAYPLWKKVYDVAPAADGKRNLVYVWGASIYNDRFQKATTDADKKENVDMVMKLYDEMLECYPKDKGYSLGRKAFDMYYNYPDYSTETEKYAIFKKSMDLDGSKAQAFVLNPFTDLLIKQYKAKAIDMNEARKYAGLIQDALANGLKTAKGQALKDYQVVEGYAPIRLEEFEAEKGFYDCDYYKRYLNEFEESPDDCTVINEAYSILSWGGCAKTDPRMAELEAAYQKHCYTPPVATNPTDPNPGSQRPRCSELLRGGDYNGAIDCYKELLDRPDVSNENKAQYALVIAKIYYRQKQYSNSRTYAERASSLKPGWGEPHLLIGKLYASSGPICGPGRGWDSQIVIFPAMDEWYKAKKDPAVSGKAQKLINQYYQYLPEKQDGFMRGVKEGDSVRIGCWIQRTSKAKFK